jgi:hypothetical protein
MFLLEYLQNNIYRSQSLHSFFEVINTNKFRTSIAEKADERFNRGKMYFMSFARHINSDFIDDMNDDDVLMVMDGYKLNNRFRTIPVRYFKHVDEAEERIITNKEYIDNAMSYIKQVHVSLAYNSYSRNFYDKIMKMHEILKKNKIDVWYYKDTQDCKRMNISKASKVPEVNIKFDPEYREWYNDPRFTAELDIFADENIKITPAEIIDTITKLIKKHILKTNFKDSIFLSHFENELINNDDLPDEIEQLFDEVIKHSNAARPYLTEFIKAAKLAKLSLDIAYIIYKIKAAIIEQKGPED